MSIKTLVADDHQVVRSGLVRMLADTDIEVVGEATNGEEAVQMALELKPDIVLLDIRMPGLDGLATLNRIHAELPDTRVIILSTYDNPTYIARAITAGASDYVLKGSSRESLITNITAVATGDIVRRSPEVRKVTGALRTTSMAANGDVGLTQRETQVLRHVALGLSNREIGRSLTISIETVKEHVQNILRKVRASDRTQAAVWAVRRGMV